MKVSHENSGIFHIQCDQDEMMILCNALGNIEQAVSKNEYTTLIGAPLDEIEVVRKAMIGALKASI
jgi:hypothetical protein